MERRVLSVNETSETLGWAHKAVYHAIHARRTQAMKVGKRLLVPAAARTGSRTRAGVPDKLFSRWR